MPVTITINGENGHQALAELSILAAAVNGTPTLTAEPVPEADERAFPEPKTPGRRKGQTNKVVEVAEVDVPAVGPTPVRETAPEPEMAETEQNTAQEAPAEQAEKTFTEDDARKALVDLGGQPDGKEKCRAVLTEFGVTKISEIKPEDRKAFIAAIAKKRGL